MSLLINNWIAYCGQLSPISAGGNRLHRMLVARIPRTVIVAVVLSSWTHTCHILVGMPPPGLQMIKPQYVAMWVNSNGMENSNVNDS